MKDIRRVFKACLITALLSACNTVKLPKLDLLKSPEFREEAENIGDYPSVNDTPLAPTDLRSKAEWDVAAKAIIEVRENFDAPPEYIAPKTADEIEHEVDTLNDTVKSYKKDDPADLNWGE